MLRIYVIDQAVYRFSTLQKSAYLFKCESSFWPSSGVQIQVVQMSNEISKDIYFFAKTWRNLKRANSYIIDLCFVSSARHPLIWQWRNLKYEYWILFFFNWAMGFIPKMWFFFETCFHFQNVKGFVSVVFSFSEKHNCKQKSLQSLQIALLMRL